MIILLNICILLWGWGSPRTDNNFSFIRNMYKYRCNIPVFIQEAERFVEGYLFFYTYFIKKSKEMNLGLCLILLLCVDPLGFVLDCIYGLHYIINAYMGTGWGGEQSVLSCFYFVQK